MFTNLDQHAFERAAQQHFVISHAQLVDTGFTQEAIEWRLIRGVLERVHDEVYRFTGSQDTYEQRVMAATLTAGDVVIASHKTAGLLWGFPGCATAQVEVTIPRGREYRARRVIAHEARRLRRIDMTSLRGVRVTTPARTAFDLASRLPADSLYEVIDFVTGGGLASPQYLQRSLRELGGRGVTGTRMFRSVLDAWIGDGGVPMSVFERRLFRWFDAPSFPGPSPSSRSCCRTARDGLWTSCFPTACSRSRRTVGNITAVR
jgi:hypothetical protein